MSELRLPPATLSALRSRHIAYLRERLTDDRARGDFVRSFAAAYDHLLSLPMSDLPEPRAWVDAARRTLTAPMVRGFLAPLTRELHRRVIAAVRESTTTVGELVPTEARRAIDELLARPDFLPPSLLRGAIEHDAVEEIMRDLSYDALVEFNASVNPFFADWGLPALLKKVLPIGSGAVLRSMGALRSEFDKRLEPEIRKFLLGFSRRSKSKLADYLIEHAADPKLVALRRSLALLVYAETLATFGKGLDDDALLAWDEATSAVLLAVVDRDRAAAALVHELERFREEHGAMTLGAFFAKIGVVVQPELEPLAELVWPLLRLALDSPPAHAFWERITWDFYATIATDSPT